MNKTIFKILKRNGVGVMPTDTIYGLVGLALSPQAVKKIYSIRHRHSEKPMIILIGGLKDLKIFGIQPEPHILKILRRLWPGKVSVILPCSLKKFRYLHRDTKTLAFRLPKNERLRRFLRLTGPLVAPSANLEGFKPAETIDESREYFGEKADFYFVGRRLKGRSSTLIDLSGSRPMIKRQGDFKISASLLAKDFKNS